MTVLTVSDHTFPAVINGVLLTVSHIIGAGLPVKAVTIIFLSAMVTMLYILGSLGKR